MGDLLELRGEASTGTIAGFVQRVAAECTRAGADEEVCYALKLAVEEVCLNVLQHGYGGGSGPLDVHLSGEDDRFVVTITDAAPPFSPEDAPVADTESGWDTRAIGGMGWHLVRQMMDTIQHETTSGGGNRVTLVKLRPSAKH
jgi:serine/threonine-protein kinase RsbW